MLGWFGSCLFVYLLDYVCLLNLDLRCGLQFLLVLGDCFAGFCLFDVVAGVGFAVQRLCICFDLCVWVWVVMLVVYLWFSCVFLFLRLLFMFSNSVALIVGGICSFMYFACLVLVTLV